MVDKLSEVLPREFLCCPLCREEFQNPKYLPCLHSFCKSCIDGHLKSRNDENITCPVCGTQTHANNSSDFPDNAFAKRLSCPSTSQRKRDKTCGQCQTAGLNKTANIHCINCDEFLCEECAFNHLEQEETASHKTQKIEDYHEADMNVTTSPESHALPLCCSFYDALDIGSTFCVDCEISLCTDCHTKFHQGHRCAELSALSQNFENKIHDPLKELKKDQHVLQRALISLEKAGKYASMRQQEAKAAVKQRTQVLCGLIQEYENMLAMEIERKHTQNQAMIHDREIAIQKHIESIKVVTDLTEKLLTFGSDEEKVSMRRQIGRRVRELCEVELPSKNVRLTKNVLNEPAVAVETICELFGVLQKHAAKKKSDKKSLGVSHSIDLGVISRQSVKAASPSPDELPDLDEYEGEDMDVLSASNTSEALQTTAPMLSENGVGEDHKPTDISELSSSHLEVHGASHNSSFQSSVGGEDVPCLNLETVKRELSLPDVVAHDCIKGVGVNSRGDIIVGTVSPVEGSKVFILEKHGIVCGQIMVEKNWMVHSIGADGKVSLVMPRSENKFKVKVMSGENNIDVLVDAHIESFGLNSVTATKKGTLLVAANRYATTNPVVGRSAKYGGNITMYDQEGTVLRVITNDTFSNLHLYLFDRPHVIATDNQGNFFVVDSGRHSVIGFKTDGEFMFEYGNTDAEEELYQGPDAVCADNRGNVIVFDKKDGRIDVLSYEGHLLKCFFPSEHIRFVCVTPDKTLLLVNSAGDMKFFDYT